MSSVAVITFIIVMLTLLVGYLLVTQTITHKRQQRERLITALTAKIRNFKYMLNGFPKGFLPKELQLLVQRSLIDLYEQLVDIDSNNPQHKQELETLALQLSETQRQSAQHQPVTIENPQQLKDAKACLEELHKFIYNLQSRRVINKSHGESYRLAIKQLVVQLSVDSYLAQGRIAKGAGKTRLAIHYFSLAHKILSKEARNNHQDKLMTQLALTLQELEQQDPVTSTLKAEASTKLAQSSEWDKVKSEGDSWKKKQVYD